MSSFFAVDGIFGEHGHATIEMTMRYAHLAPSALDDAIERLEGTYRARDEMALGN